MTKNLPQHWKDWIKSYALKVSKGKYENLGAGTFKRNVKIIFPDDSYCSFNGAFFVEDEEKNELLVVTEHCGYHVFPLYHLKIEYYES
jgi:hypothetical protein